MPNVFGIERLRPYSGTACRCGRQAGAIEQPAWVYTKDALAGYSQLEMFELERQEIAAAIQKTFAHSWALRLRQRIPKALFWEERIRSPGRRSGRTCPARPSRPL